MRTELARRSLASFVRQAWHVIEPTTDLVWGWHLDAVCEHLEAISARQLRGLVIEVPPRSSKSSIVSVLWPAWEWATRPQTRFLTASYALDLAIRDALRSRRVLLSPWYQQRWGDVFGLSGDQNVKSRYENDRTGYRIAQSVGSGTTGEGGDITVIDDAHAVSEAESDAVRNATILWHDQAFYNRLNNAKTGARVIIGQRVHDEDLIGHVLRQGGFEELRIPEEFEPKARSVTSLGGGKSWQDPREDEGELLRPQRFGMAEVADAKVRLGSRGYAAQHQQRPAPAEGALFKRSWLRYYDVTSPGVMQLEKRTLTLGACRIFVTADLATSTKTSADYTALAAWADDRKGCLVLLDMVRERMEGPDIVPAISALMSKWKAQYVAIEVAGFQLSIMQEARRKGLASRELKAHKDKITRAIPATVRMEAGQIWFPRPAACPWVGDLEAELFLFPVGTHDDMVDALAYAAEEMTRTPGATTGGAKPVGTGAPRI